MRRFHVTDHEPAQRFFFFQAEDGIRDYKVTGVQTCALPISLQWFIDGGASVTEGRTADFLDSGWSIGTGFTLRPVPGQPFMLRADLNYNRFSATDQLISLGQAVNQTPVDNGYGQTVTGVLNGGLEAPV